VTAFRILVTATAERHLETIQTWWVVNRPDVPFLFVDEVEAAFERISRAPSSGAVYPRTRLGTSLHRVLLRRTRYHVYYTCDPASRRATIRAIWYAARGRSPQLK
jgi:plasmid stabilization system protein ParE